MYGADNYLFSLSSNSKYTNLSASVSYILCNELNRFHPVNLRQGFDNTLYSLKSCKTGV